LSSENLREPACTSSFPFVLSSSTLSGRDAFSSNWIVTREEHSILSTNPQALRPLSVLHSSSRVEDHSFCPSTLRTGRDLIYSPNLRHSVSCRNRIRSKHVLFLIGRSPTKKKSIHISFERQLECVSNYARSMARAWQN